MLPPPPQVDEETGVSQDYYNEWYFRGYPENEKYHEMIADSFRTHPVKRYEDRFPSTQFSTVITPHNETAVKRLDEIALMANTQWVNKHNFTSQEYEHTLDEIARLIYGEKANSSGQ